MSTGWATDFALDQQHAGRSGSLDPQAQDLPPEAPPYLMAWCTAHGAPPEVVLQVLEQARAPVGPGRAALARAVVALVAESIAGPGSWAALWAETAARCALWALSFRALNERGAR